MQSIDENIEIENRSLSNEDTMVKAMSNNGHDKQRNFVQYFTVNKPTALILVSAHNIGHGNLCAFAKEHIKDCSFHHPCK
jgi:hypothetical protein